MIKGRAAVKFNPLYELGRMLTLAVQGFFLAMGIAAAKWVITFIPLAGFNLTF